MHDAARDPSDERLEFTMSMRSDFSPAFSNLIFLSESSTFSELAFGPEANGHRINLPTENAAGLHHLQRLAQAGSFCLVLSKGLV